MVVEGNVVAVVGGTVVPVVGGVVVVEVEEVVDIVELVVELVDELVVVVGFVVVVVVGFVVVVVDEVVVGTVLVVVDVEVVVGAVVVVDDVEVLVVVVVTGGSHLSTKTSAEPSFASEPSVPDQTIVKVSFTVPEKLDGTSVTAVAVELPVLGMGCGLNDVVGKSLVTLTFLMVAGEPL